MRVSKQVKPAIEYAEAHGWTLKRVTQRNTAIFEKPGCSDVAISMYPKDHRAVANQIARFKREDCQEKEQHKP